jgi:ABC-type uncharacterized transport system permease subunit
MIDREMHMPADPPPVPPEKLGEGRQVIRVRIQCGVCALIGVALGTNIMALIEGSPWWIWTLLVWNLGLLAVNIWYFGRKVAVGVFTWGKLFGEAETWFDIWATAIGLPPRPDGKE